MNIPPVSGSPVNNDSIIKQIDGFIAGLSMPAGTTVATSVVTKTVSASATPPPEPLKVEPPQTDEDIEKFVLKNSAELVENSVKSILDLQKLAVATGDAELVASLASLIAASTSAIETVNKLHLHNKKVKAAKEMKEIDLRGKKEIQALKNEGYLNLPAGNTNILVATREEIMQQLTGKAKKQAAGVYEIEVPTLSSAP